MGRRSIPSKVFVFVFKVVVSEVNHEPIHCVARGDGCYELQSFKVHCSFRITYLLCIILSLNAIDRKVSTIQ